MGRGRPKVKYPKSVHLSIRVSPGEHLFVEQMAKAFDDTITWLFWKGLASISLTEEQIELINKDMPSKAKERGIDEDDLILL